MDRPSDKTRRGHSGDVFELPVREYLLPQEVSFLLGPPQVVFRRSQTFLRRSERFVRAKNGQSAAPTGQHSLRIVQRLGPLPE